MRIAEWKYMAVVFLMVLIGGVALPRSIEGNARLLAIAVIAALSSAVARKVARP